jgi:hypothetical protein
MRLLAALAGTLLLSGCSMTLPVQGLMQNGGERFTGTATGYTDGGGNLTVKTTSGATCRGTFVYVTSREGSGTFECSDGRSGPFDFVSTGSRGTGKGSLSGETFTFSFGR